MEVKVQYMVDLDEIPKEVVKLLPYGVDVFENRLSNIVSLVENASYSLSLDEIEALRVEMYKIDQRLADCQAILKGYLSIKNRPPEPESQDIGLEQLQGMLQSHEEGVVDDSAS
tara:strand:- start:373 stop:714 length:342 start_codon:yes stop_codon:yes gene_type:complete